MSTIRRRRLPVPGSRGDNVFLEIAVPRKDRLASELPIARLQDVMKVADVKIYLPAVGMF